MKYSETGFRPFYHHFCVFPLIETTKNTLNGFPKYKNTNGILTYGYLDDDSNLMLEVIAAAYTEGKGTKFNDTVDSISHAIDINDVADIDAMYFGMHDEDLTQRYQLKISNIHLQYNDDDGVERCRMLSFLDRHRHNKYIDFIEVVLVKEGFQYENVLVRLLEETGHSFIGALLQTPKQDLGVSEGNLVEILVAQEENDVIPFVDLNHRKKVTEKDLEDQTLLEEAVNAYSKENTKYNLYKMLEILRDSYVWVPCNSILSDRDQTRFVESMKQFEGHEEEMVGDEFTALDEVRLVPDILINGNNYYFPIFTSIEAMGEYGEGFSKIQKHIFEVLPLYRNNEKHPVSIIINAFSNPAEVSEGACSLLEMMHSNLE